MTSGMIGGHAVVAFLKARGVDTVFGIPGVHTLDLYRGLAELGVRHIGVRHEQGAGFMGDGAARRRSGSRPRLTRGVSAASVGPASASNATVGG